jgi:hypothetical protein
MGLCFSDAATKARVEESRRVDKEIDLAKREAERRIKLLLLGELPLEHELRRAPHWLPACNLARPALRRVLSGLGWFEQRSVLCLLAMLVFARVCV